ncbi:MlaD family protein [Nocardia takedensis]|uniref:MlaD family protein n=1 Tax=Nocardia takedensis TaxID=259390 RepID=UPI003F768DFC
MSALIETPARLLVGAVRAGRARRSTLSAAALVLTLALGVAYLTVGALGLRPGESVLRVRVHLAESGGLLAGQDVTLRGVPIGTVESVRLSGSGLVAVAVIDAAIPVPADGAVRVASLSPAGSSTSTSARIATAART